VKNRYVNTWGLVIKPQSMTEMARRISNNFKIMLLVWPDTEIKINESIIKPIKTLRKMSPVPFANLKMVKNISSESHS